MWRRALTLGSPRLALACACGATALLAAAAAYSRRVAGVPLVAARDEDGVLGGLPRRELLERRARLREAAGAGAAELEVLRALIAAERAKEAASGGGGGAGGGSGGGGDEALTDDDLVLK